MIKPARIVPVTEIVDFKSGPFSDDRKFNSSMRRTICEQLLRQLIKFPKQNAALIIVVNETLKGFR